MLGCNTTGLLLDFPKNWVLRLIYPIIVNFFWFLNIVRWFILNRLRIFLLLNIFYKLFLFHLSSPSVFFSSNTSSSSLLVNFHNILIEINFITEKIFKYLKYERFYTCGLYKINDSFLYLYTRRNRVQEIFFFYITKG